MTSIMQPPLSSCSFAVKYRYFLVTGGSQGLGLEIARQLKIAGASGLVLVSRSKDKGESAVAELMDENCKVWHLQADLSKADEAAGVFPRAERLIGSENVINGVVNAAATAARGNLFTTTAESFDMQMALNVRAPFLITQGAANHMMKNKATGSIVNISSAAAHGGAPFIMAYSCAKSALVTLTKNNAAELAPRGIRVNAINMGWCLTDNEDYLQSQQSDSRWIERADQSVPLGRILRPVDVAATVCFLLSNASRMTTGSIIDLHPEYPHGMISLLEKDSR